MRRTAFTTVVIGLVATRLLSQTIASQAGPSGMGAAHWYENTLVWVGVLCVMLVMVLATRRARR